MCLILQAGQWLQNQMGEQGASAQALVDAKNELLALQEIVHQKDADVLALSGSVQQRDDEVQQLVARLDAATRDYAVVHEESRQLHNTVRQYEEALVAERAQHTAMLNELRGESAVLERESARLALERLHKENEELHRREAESAEVVGRLMADVEAGHRDVVRPHKLVTTAVTYTREEHDADVEQQILALRAELEEAFGDDISHMKEQMREHYSATVDQLQRDLARTEEERSLFAGQASLWQQQYMALSQQGVSSVDIAQRLNDAVADNVQQRQHVAELTAQVEQLNAQLSSSLHSRSSSKSVGSETSSELEEYKREIAETIGAESRSLRTKVDELSSLLNDACEDRDRSVARCQSVEQELNALRQELRSTHTRHSEDLQEIEAKAASDVAQLTSQLVSAKEQLQTVQFVSVETSNARDEMEHTLHEKQSQFETVKKDCEHRIEQLKIENADVVERLSNEYTRRLESESMKITAVIDEYGSREQKSLALIEELQKKYEIVMKENRAVNEQVERQSDQMPLNADVLSTPSGAVWGASDVDSLLAHLSSQLEKVTRERDSAMQSLQTVYRDRIELQQTIKTLESEHSALTTRVNHLDTERQSLGEQVTEAHAELSRLKDSAISRSADSLSSVGMASIPNMPFTTDESDRQGPDVIDSLRAEFEELQRLRREKDRSSSSSTLIAASSAVNVLSHSEVNVNVNMTSAAVANKTQDDGAAGKNLSAGEAEDVLGVEEVSTMKQEYSALCSELVRLREMLITLQRVDHEREQVRSQFELEIRLLRDELLHRDQVDAAAVTETVEVALGDEVKERDAEIASLKERLAMTLSRMEELIAEKDQQCASYEHELEEVHEEHSSALKRIDALVQEHNILVGGQVPLSSVSPESVREMAVVIHSEILENVDEDVSPKRMAYENQAKEIEHLRQQLHQAAQEIETLSLDRDKLNEALESNTAELLASLEKAAYENTEQQQMYERNLATYTQDIEQLNRKLDTMSAELEQSKSAHMSEMEKLREEYQAQFNELSFSNDESKHEQHQELYAVRKQCAEMRIQLEQITAEKASMEQEYVTVLQDVNKENSARISALREGFEQDLAQAQLESEKAYSDHAVQLEEELSQSRQEIGQLKQSLEQFEGGPHHFDKHQSEIGDLEATQVLQLRINDLTETKDELVKRLDAVTAENERLISEVLTLQADKVNLRSDVATLQQDYPQGNNSLDAESVADTSGDSHIFYNPAKSRKTVVEKLKSVQAEKETLTNMVERLNAEKEQLKSQLITGHQPTHVFEADIRHLELSSPEIVKVNQVENIAEVRMIALESEKELLAGMLEKLSCENEQLVAFMTAASDNILDTSYDDAVGDNSNIEKSAILDAYEEPELTADEVVALRYEHAVLRAKLSNLQREVSSVNAQPTDGQQNVERTFGVTRDVEMVHSSIQTDIQTPDQPATTSDVEHLHRTVEHVARERDVALSEMLAVKKGICAIMDCSVPADESQQEMSADSMLAALDVFIRQAVECENAASQETVSELQSQIARLHNTNESALTEVRKILSEIHPSFLPDSAGDSQHVDVTDSESDALLIALQLLKGKKATADALPSTAISETTTSQQALLLESITEERDKLYKELENARQQLAEVLPYRETVSVDNEQTIGSLIDQINQLVYQKNKLEELNAEKAESRSNDHEATVSCFRSEAEAATRDPQAQLTEDSVTCDRLTAALVDSSVQVDLRTVHRLEGLQVDSDELQQMLECPTTESRGEDDFVDTKAFDSRGRDQSSKDPSLRADEAESQHALAENVRMLEESLSTVTAERDKLSADLAQVVQECVELKASRADLIETTKHSIEALRNELDNVRSDHKALAERDAATDRQLAKVTVERDVLAGKIGALQDALKLALEEIDIQSRLGTEAQLPTVPDSAGSVTVTAEMDYRVSEMPQSAEVSPVESDLVKSNMWLQTRVKELEVVQINLLDEKESVAELYCKTVDELKARLVEMQATVESLRSEISVKSQENEAVVGDLTSHLHDTETKHSQTLLDLAEVHSSCEEKKRIIDELTSRLQSVIDSKSDDDDPESGTKVLLASKVDFLQSEVNQLSQECDQLSVRQIAHEQLKAEAFPHCDDGTLAKESQLSGLVAEETGDNFSDTGVSELQQVVGTPSIVQQCTKLQTAEQCTMTEESAFLGTDDMKVDEVNVESDLATTAHVDEDVSALQVKLQTLKAELETVIEERDEFAAKLSALEHSSGSDGFIKDADLAVIETGFRAAAIVENTDSTEQTTGLLVSEGVTDGQLVGSEATDHKERYLHLHSRHCIAVSDESVDVKNVTDKSAAETVDAAVETDDALQVKIDQLFNETCSLKEERDEIRQKLLLAKTCIQETQDSAKEKIKVLEDELASVREELHRFETCYKTLESEQQETAQMWIVKTQQHTEELHAVTVERDSLSAELESTKHDLDACQRSCEEKTSSAENYLEDLQSELSASVQTQQALTDELTTCKMRLEETASYETKLSLLTGKYSELEAVLSTVEQERDAVKEDSITSCTQLEELKHLHEQTAASMKSKIEDLEVQLAAVKDENITLTTNCIVAVDNLSDLKNTQTEIESNVRSQIVDLEGQIKSLNVELENASLNLSAAERKYEELQQSLASSSADAASKLKTLSSELKTATEEKSELIIKLADVDRTCTELKSQLESTSEDRDSLMNRLREVESEQTELKKGVIGHQEALVNIECLEKECRRLNEELKCLSERCDASDLAKTTVESRLFDQQQRISAFTIENHELIQSKELLVSENGSLKQQISEYIDKVNTFASNEQTALANWSCMEEQLLAKIKGLETDLSVVEVENGTLKGEVERISLLTGDRDDARKRCFELEAEVVKLRESVENFSKKFDLTSTELTETKAELTQRCDEAECEVNRLKKLADEKSSCVLELKSALARTQEELTESQKERETLSSDLASERNAVQEQTAANEAAMSEVMSRLSVAKVASSKLEQLEKEFALKCEELKVAKDQLLQRQSVQQEVGSVDPDVETCDVLQQEYDDLRTLVGNCQVDANTAREKLSQMEGLCQALTAERDELMKEKCTLHAENGELSDKLVLLQQHLERMATDAAAHETKVVEQHMFVERLDVTPHDDVNDSIGMQDEQNLVDGTTTSQNEKQIMQMNEKILAVESELETARDTVQKLQEEVNSLLQENRSLQQMKQAAEDNLNTVTLELAISPQPDTARRLQQELAGEQSSRATEGWEELQTRLHELDALTEVKTAICSTADSTTSVSSVHASRTFTKHVSSDVVACLTAVEMSNSFTGDKHILAPTEVKFQPDIPSESSDDSFLVHASRTYTKLVSTDAVACQTVAETEIDHLYGQISRLQHELEQQKLSQCQLIEKLQAHCVELAKTRDVLLQENSFLSEQLKEKSSGNNASSMTDYGMIQSQLHVEIEAETKRHYQSAIEALETEYQEKLMALKDECDRRVSAAENCSRAEVLECSPSETSVVEDGDSTIQLSDAINQRDQLRLHLAEKTTEISELRTEIERLREENEKQKTSSSVVSAVAESMDLNEETQRIITNLQSQLIMSVEENERQQEKINYLEQQVAQENVVRQQTVEQHLTEIEVLKFQLQQSYEQRLSRVRTEVEAELENAYQKRKEALDAEFEKKSKQFRKETERKFVQELKKVCKVIKFL